MSTPEAVEESRRKDEKNTETGRHELELMPGDQVGRTIQSTSNCVVVHLKLRCYSPLIVLCCDQYVLVMAFSPDGKLLLTVSANEVGPTMLYLTPNCVARHL